MEKTPIAGHHADDFLRSLRAVYGLARFVDENLGVLFILVEKPVFDKILRIVSWFLFRDIIRSL